MLTATLHRNALADRTFSSVFVPSSFGESILRNGGILDTIENPRHMIERVVHTLFSIEAVYGTSQKTIRGLAQEFGALLDTKKCVMSTPIMNNAGRYESRPLSACTVPPIDLRSDLKSIKKLLDRYHEDGMGTGFNLNDTVDPVSTLKFLNDIAIDGAHRGNEDRPVGNMAVLSAHHPLIQEFIRAKTFSDALGETWKFNISVDATDAFMSAVMANTDYKLWDKRTCDARTVFDAIVESAHRCGDPGLVFISRLNRDNPTPRLGSYVSTAPCGEVGLAPGETCQFGYINLGEFVHCKGAVASIDLRGLDRTTRLMTRALDNALEVSMKKFPHPMNELIMAAKRKIGVGVCGLADMLIKLRLPYGSAEAREVAADTIAFINFVSKLASHELAKQRGSFDALLQKDMNRYTEQPGFLEDKYGAYSTRSVPDVMWHRLAELIRSTQLLRNASTIALPPTGRSGLVIDASTGIEPLFSLVDPQGAINENLIKDLKARNLLTPAIELHIREFGCIGDLEYLPSDIRALYQTALELTPDQHLAMAASLQKFVDESISKTINLPARAQPLDIASVYMKAYSAGLKGISVYRADSRVDQPRSVARI